MARVEIEIVIDAPPERVWRALTEPSEVTEWDGAVPIAIPEGYPAPGQHALWRTRLGPLPVKLHDRVRCVEPRSRLKSTIDFGFVHFEEEYTLNPLRQDHGVALKSDNAVSSRIPGLSWLADRIVRSGVAASMERLSELCAREHGATR